MVMAVRGERQSAHCSGTCGPFATLVSFGPSSQKTGPSNGSERFDGEQKEVDDHRETLHNLASLLLTNKTIRRAQQAVPNTVL
jgi:hypothetical protein